MSGTRRYDDLVDLVHEHDAGLLDPLNGQFPNGIHVDQLGGLLGLQRGQRRRNLHASAPFPAGYQAAQQILELHAHFFHALGREERHRGNRARIFEIELHLTLGEVSLAEHVTQLVAGVAGARLLRLSVEAGNGGRRRKQDVQQAILGTRLGLGLHGTLLLLRHQRDANLDQIANDRLDVPSDVADLGELRRFDLDERCLGQLRQAPGDLGFSDARGPDHDDVLGSDLVSEFLGNLLAAPTVAQGDRDGALGLALANNVAIEFRDDLSRREGVGRAHGSVTTERLSFV